MASRSKMAEPEFARAKLSLATWAMWGLALAVMILLGSARHAPPPLGSQDFLIAPPFGIPSPPHATPYNAAGTLYATILLGGIGLFATLSAGIHCIRTRTLLPLAVALSGVFGIFAEVFVDIVGAVYYPTTPTDRVFDVLGRGMPMWSLFVWYGYTSTIYFAFRQLESRPSTRTLWLLWGAALLLNLVLEELLLNAWPGLYHYYGNQPLVAIAKLPLWWLPCNSLGIFLVLAIAYRFREVLTGIRAFSLLLIMPGCLLAIYGFIALPSFIVVNGNYSWLATQFGGLATLALGVVAFCLILKLVLNRNPFDMTCRDAEA